MSLIKAIKAQLGLSVTPANNFTLDASADNGTMKLARGNAGATTQDVMTVDAAGKAVFPNNRTNFRDDSLMGGGKIKMYRSNVTFDGTGTAVVTFLAAFPSNVAAVFLTNSNAAAGGDNVVLTAFAVTLSGFNVRAIQANTGTVYTGVVELSYLVIGE